jgi:hypothetical protein
MIEVADTHIEQGKRGNCDACPIALAARPVLGRVEVGSRWICSGNWSAALPREACEFIQRYDAGDESYPFAFTLEIPDEVTT